MRTLTARVAAFCLVSAASTALGVGPVYNVNSLSDVVDASLDGICNTTADNANPTCTLRAAVMEANHYSGAEEVTINLQTGTYPLTRAIGVPDDDSNGDLDLLGHVRIVGKGPDLSIVDANHLDRIFRVASTAVVTLSDLRVQNGAPPFSHTRLADAFGGGIYNEGALSLIRCLVRANAAADNFGGGICSFAGSLSLVDSVVRVNSAGLGTSEGGGIYAGSTATVIRGSTINANTAGYGGGIEQDGGSLAITNTTISQNAGLREGGGLYLFSITGVALNNVTVATNTASDPAPNGGGIKLQSASVVLTNSILSNSNNASGTVPDDLGCAGTTSVLSNGYNVIVASACAITGAYDSQNPALGTIMSNGGLTATHALTAGSPAVNAGDPAGCTDAFGAPLLVDQRGVSRPIGARCDLGAFEREPVGDANGDGIVSVSDVFCLINYLFAGGPVPLGRANVNGDASTDIADVFYLINYLFAGGQAPPNV